MGKKLSVTGALGYIGSWPVKRLLQNGHTVHATLRDPAVANTQIDWNETQMRTFKGRSVRSVKIEVEDGRILKTSGERNKEPEQKKVAEEWSPS